MDEPTLSVRQATALRPQALGPRLRRAILAKYSGLMAAPGMRRMELGGVETGGMGLLGVGLVAVEGV